MTDEKTRTLDTENTPNTTFMMDFKIACWSGKAAILDTFNRAAKEWIDNVEYFTQLVIALNHLSWFFYEHDRPNLSELFADLFYKAQDMFYAKYENDKDAMHYYFVLTD